ncbi:hypothetical protein QJS04_geneDACA006827 [Acorus gramineus]|uniref:DNA polymerase n=1 Tax=Acorus gramineus TaxID=55184 RepID=A0AAV9AWQ5_ACOGR|nr:hypothetical protein QJS04_geneDACA006827 [Acorus gramineus]
MAPATEKNKKKKREASPSDPEGMFRGMFVFLVEIGVQPRRLQIWRQKLVQMGATVEDHLTKRVTHIFAMDSKKLHQKVDYKHLLHFGGSLLQYGWLESSLKVGERVSEDLFMLDMKSGGTNESGQISREIHSDTEDRKHTDDKSSHDVKTRTSGNDLNDAGGLKTVDDPKTADFVSIPREIENYRSKLDSKVEPGITAEGSSSPSTSDAANPSTDISDASNVEISSVYNPPDLNRNITEIFGRLINIYRALGDDRRSFSYYKAIPVIEKLPFKIESVDQVRHLPTIGKSLKDHINEIITTGKLSKLEHFETDEKVRTVSLFGEVWGIGPATALKLYEKEHRTLDDLKNEESLSHSQKLGLKYFDDIKKRIPRHEVKDMEALLQKVGQDISPGVIVVCGGSFRRGKSSCGDMDIIITHPDGKSHKGFLPRYVKYLKDMKFLREDLVFSIHSTEGTDSGVDTYFGLCTYPGQEQRHRIDLKVYPRDIYAFGLVAWTGNDVLNRRLRLLAESKGYRLDDTGLFLATQTSSGKRGAKSSISLTCKTEREVFDELGFPWLEPHERNL